MTTAEILTRFNAEYQVARSITPERTKAQLHELERLATFIEKSLLDLTQQDLLTYLGSELARGLAPNTVRKNQGQIRSFITWAEMAGLMTNPEQIRQLRLVGNPRGSSAYGVPKPYSSAEIKRFRAALATRYPLLPQDGPGSRALQVYFSGRRTTLRKHLWRHARRLQFEAQVALALEMGLRVKEIHDLNIDRAHYDNDAVVVYTAKSGPGQKKVRQVPWTRHARQRMMDWLDFRESISPPNDSLWLLLSFNRPAIQLDPQTLDNIRLALDPLPGGWRWHRFRHTAATEWLRAGLPVEKLQILLGHASIEQTLAYTKIAHGDIQDAMSAAHNKFARRMGLPEWIGEARREETG